MKRIILHHTGGTYKPNQVDKKAYHYLIDGNGDILKGYYKPEDNEDCTDGRYAAHTKLGNTGSIGIAACCNYAFSPTSKCSKFPLLQKQFEAMCKLAAQLSIKYNIKSKNIYTHWYFDKTHNINQGKCDIIFLPFKPELNPYQVNEYFKSKIKWYCKHL